MCVFPLHISRIGSGKARTSDPQRQVPIGTCPVLLTGSTTLVVVCVNVIAVTVVAQIYVGCHSNATTSLIALPNVTCN